MKKHLFVDIDKMLAYRCSIPDIFLAKFVPRLSKLPKQNRKDIAPRLMTNYYDNSCGFSPHLSHAFDGNPYRTDQPYIPSCDIPPTGVWSNALWFLVDIITTEASSKFRFYRRPNIKRLRKLWCGPISNWNSILATIEPWQGVLEDVQNFKPLYLWQNHWPVSISQQIADAEYAEVAEPSENGDCLSYLTAHVRAAMLSQSRRVLY